MIFLHDAHEINAHRAGDVCLSTLFNSKSVRWIRIESGMDVMPLGITLKSYFSVSYNR